jgi:lipid-A-disaccharide synthase
VKVFISAGEPSGDRHASDLIRELRNQNGDVDIEGFGGRHMRQAGAEIVYPLADEPIIGITAVLPRLLFYRRLLKQTVERLKSQRTGVLVLVDYPGFNLRLAEAARRAGIRTVYYIGPQVWAWGAGRIERIKRALDLMLVVFDFELGLYERAGVPVRFVGHPLLDQLNFDYNAADFRRRQGLDADALLIGLFPGSRRSEIDRIFPVLLNAGEKIRSALVGVQLVAAVAPALKRDLLEGWSQRTGVKVTLIENATHPLMHASDLALVASGTATLETALLGTPELVLYRTDPITYHLARQLLNISRIGLVNLVAQKEIAPEFIQHRCNADTVASAAIKYLQNRSLKREFLPESIELRRKLGKPGAARRAAQAILELAQL